MYYSQTGMRHRDWHNFLWVFPGLKILAVWILSWNGWHPNSRDKCICWQGLKMVVPLKFSRRFPAWGWQTVVAVTNAIPLSALQLISETKQAWVHVPLCNRNCYIWFSLSLFWHWSLHVPTSPFFLVVLLINQVWLQDLSASKPQ